jgi:hypothetical protein
MEYGQYTVRVSQRARKVHFVVSRRHGLEVVVPAGFDRGRIPELLADKRDWLARTAARLGEEAARVPRDEAGDLPQVVRLRAVAEEWRVAYRAGSEPAGRGRPRVREYPSVEHAGPIEYAGPIGQAGPIEGRDGNGPGSLEAMKPAGFIAVPAESGREAPVRTALSRWLESRARLHLPGMVASTARELGLDYAGVSIRAQKTRWGSCSRAGAISLNCTLLFLPAHLVDYVLVHELCHRRELNHSDRFWAMVGGFRPDWKLRRRELRKASAYVPPWVELWMEERRRQG